jgi:DNA-binding XRE family transcriptional regulator
MKHIVISSCTECPFYICELNLPYCCKIQKNLLEPLSIPNQCPLSSYHKIDTSQLSKLMLNCILQEEEGVKKEFIQRIIFPVILRKTRLLANLSHEQLAKRMKVLPSTINAIELGEVVASVRFLKASLEICKVSEDIILEDLLEFSVKGDKNG